MTSEDTPNVAIWPQGVPGVERNFYRCLRQNRNPRVYHVATFGGHTATLGVPIWPHLCVHTATLSTFLVKIYPPVVMPIKGSPPAASACQ